MASASGSGASATQYDVFLSFRGPDTRATFTDCLYRTMVGQGINAYRDSEELHAGDRIDDLLRAVGNSKICIPIFSRGYASSPWCLRELARMMALKESTGKPEILPIFFDVSASDVKLKTKLYVEDLEKYEQRPGGERKEQWEAALGKVGKIVGWEVQGKLHGEVIDLVVKEVLRKLKVKQRHLDSKLVGVDEQVEAIMELLDVDSGTGVRFVGIHGMGGIGKTTLAKSVFNELCPLFDSQCSFLENIRESSNRIGLEGVQKRLASDISDSRFVKDFGNTDEGIDSIKRRAGSKKVLIVLDDLDKKEQLKQLVGGPHTFGYGSKIIITTRDKTILDEVSGILPYEVMQMDHDKALELFSLHAFDSASLPNAYQSLSRAVVSTTGGLPLALEVIGSYLHCQNEEIWKEMLKRLENVPHNKVRDKLKITYDALQYEEKEIFLDIACFFIDEEKSRVTYFWEACDLYPHSSLKKLADFCLIKIIKRQFKGDVIWMHDQLKDLGRDIIRQECSQNLTKRSRLWNGEEARKAVQSKERKDKVRALKLVESSSDSIIIDRMPNLKFLKLRGGTFVGDINNHVPELRWLTWDFPLPCATTNFHLENLAVLELSNVSYGKKWGGWNILKIPNKLKDLSLKECGGLKRTPDFSGCLSLERLSLFYCRRLQEVDSSIGKLKCLTHLTISNCASLRNLPEEIGGLVKMMHFSIYSCRDMEKLPYSIGDLTQLEFLSLSCFESLRELPESISNLKLLQNLNLSATSIVELPDSIENLKRLKVLDISESAIRRLPASIGMLERLEELNARYCEELDGELPTEIGELSCLRILDLSGTRVRAVPPAISSLTRLEELRAQGCEQLAGELPTEIGELLSLRILDMSKTRVCAVPPAINSLTRLQNLDLTDCNELQELPKLPPSLNCLRVQSTSLRLVPDLSNLTNLVELNLSNGSGRALAQASNPTQTLQLQWVGKLSKLENLTLRLSNVTVSSSELGCLPRLRELTFSCLDSFDSVVVGPQFSNLKYLSILCLYRSPPKEIRLDGLELLRELRVWCCEFLEGLSIISSSMGKLKTIAVWRCPRLSEIRFICTMESLDTLIVGNCKSLEGLYGLSNSKKLTSLRIHGCDGLRIVEGLEELELLCSLNIYGCGSLERLIDVSNSKIPNECLIGVWHCAKLLGTEEAAISPGTRYWEYREMILGKTRKRKTFSPVSEDSTEENDSSDCSDSEDSVKENDTIDCPDLEDPMKDNDSEALRVFQRRSLRRKIG